MLFYSIHMVARISGRSPMSCRWGSTDREGMVLATLPVVLSFRRPSGGPWFPGSSEASSNPQGLTKFLASPKSWEQGGLTRCLGAARPPLPKHDVSRPKATLTELLTAAKASFLSAYCQLVTCMCSPATSPNVAPRSFTPACLFSRS
jgi:hypothetical protein